MITLTSNLISTLTPAEVLRCRRLTLGRRGQMLNQFCRELRKGEDSGASAILAKDNTGLIYGWALIFNEDTDFNDAFFFVDPTYRRCGIAHQLVEYVLQSNPMPRFHPHDLNAAVFFVRYQGRFREEKGVSERIDYARSLLALSNTVC